MRWAAGSFTKTAAQAVQEIHMQALTKSQGRAPRTNALKHAALGFRAHSGWAALVVVAAPSRSPAVIDRRRIELVDPGIPKQPYHAAQKLDLKEAEELVRRCTETARLLARRAFRAVIDDLRGDRKSTRLNSSHLVISYAVFCLKKKKKKKISYLFELS